MRSDAPRSMGGGDDMFAAVLMFAVAVLVASAYMVLEVGTWLGSGRWASVTALVTGWVHSDTTDCVLPGCAPRWSGWHTVLLVFLVGVIVFGLVQAGRWNKRRVAAHADIDRKAKLMGSPDDASREAAHKDAVVGRMVWDEMTSPGLHYGNAIVDGTPLYMGFRETGWAEVGMGGGKSSAIIIPAIDQAPGNCVTTNMKRDVPDAVRGLCEERGRFFCLDPMRITDYYPGEPPWWWNPLRDVTGPVPALRLATIFAEASAPLNATKHGFFDTKGPNLLAALLLAAAVSGQQITQAYTWVNTPDDDTPMLILKKPFPLSSQFLRGIYNGHNDTREDLFATAGNAIEFLTDPDIQQWVTDSGYRPEFDPAEFVKPYATSMGERVIKRDTLMLLSKKGDGSAGPLTTALATSVLKAATREAARWPHGRLPIPLVMPFDELPNTAPMPSLPDEFTILGSHGITPIVCVQNWAQATRAWQDAGAMQLFNGSTTRIVGSGLADAAHLQHISTLVGKRWETRRSATSGGPHDSMQVSQDRAPIMEVDELMALGGWRFVLLRAGSYGVLGKLLPWWERSDLKPRVQASIEKYEPAGVKL